MIGNVGDDRLPLCPKRLDALADQRMISRDYSDGIAKVAEGDQPRSNVLRFKLVDELDHRIDMLVPPLTGRLADFLGDELIKLTR